MIGTIMSGRRGGVRLFSVIGVTYPAGSVCTCTKGTKTYKAKNTSGLVLFAVPEIGAWTVSCTDGTETASATATVSAEGEAVNVVLNYGIIYDTGTVSPYVELNMISNPSGIYTVEYGQNSLAFKTTSGKGAGFLCAKVNISEYSTLKVSYESLNMQNGIGYAAINQTATADYDTTPDAHVQFTSTGAGTKETSLDISSFSGEYYVGIWDRKWDSYDKTLTVNKIWME